MSGEKSLSRLPQNKFIIGLLIAYTLSEAQHLWFTGTINTFVFWSKKVIIFFLISNIIDTPRKLQNAFIWTLLAVITLNLYAWSFYFEDPTLQMFRGRLGSIGHYNFSNSFAMLLTVSWPLFFALFEVKGFLMRKTIFLALLLSFIVANIMTFSRGGIFGMTIAITTSLLLSKKTLKTRVVKWLIVGGVIIFFFTFITEFVVSKRAGVGGFFGGDASAGDRIQAWVAAVRMFLTYPLLGIGYGHFAEEGKNYGMDRSMPAHNTFLSVLAETGIFGIIFFVLILFYSFKILRQTIKYFEEKDNKDVLLTRILSKGIGISLLVFLVNTSFSVKDHDPIFWLVISFAAACGNIMTRHKELKASTI